MNSWAQTQASAIARECNADYGRGWQKLSPEQRRAVRAQKLLMLLLTQQGEQFQAAQDMLQSIIAQMPEEGV